MGKAIFLAAVCSQTYMQFSQNGAFIVPTDYSPVGSFTAESLGGGRELFGFILESERDAIVAFRGTSTTEDWITDAMVAQVDYKWVKQGGLVHRGFARVYGSAREQILAALNRMQGDKPLTITGHSLGGALAVLCAPDVSANSRFRLPCVYTYGAPRAGDPAYAKTFGSRAGASFRVQNVYDAVPHLPPFIMKLPRRGKVYYYSHVRREAPLDFQNGSVSANHVISSYFNDLAGKDPAYAKRMCARNPGFCPA
ncbi:lipase family protein [Cohnella faecalis]|uniref:Lipase family protein n=2 Tax=Cohnella faecalis TaxID=2315694 RepID=A0A398CNR8_9BACL|nr:lipase family protein [Cohnella faecalis]